MIGYHPDTISYLVAGGLHQLSRAVEDHLLQLRQNTLSRQELTASRTETYPIILAFVVGSPG